MPGAKSRDAWSPSRISSWGEAALLRRRARTSTCSPPPPPGPPAPRGQTTSRERTDLSLIGQAGELGPHPLSPPSSPLAAPKKSRFSHLKLINSRCPFSSPSNCNPVAIVFSFPSVHLDLSLTCSGKLSGSRRAPSAPSLRRAELLR